MTRTQAFEGFILKKIALLDTSYSIVFFTKELGKISVIAKGVKTITSKRAGHLQTGNLVRFHAHKHVSGAWYLGSTTLVSGLVSLKSSPERMAVLYHSLQLLDLLLPDGEMEMVTFRAYKAYITKLHEQPEESTTLFFGFARSLIEHLGFGVHTIKGYAELTRVMQTITDRSVEFVKIS
jgi:DNA repair protein RecO (recombination protein O)